MTRASQAPYYLAMAIYLGLNAVLWFILNQTVNGNLSDIYMVASIVAGLTCVSCVFYAFAEDDGADTTSADVKIPFINLVIPKWFYYLASISVMTARMYFGYESNHNATGTESLWGFAWIVATLIVFLATLPNVKVYINTRKVAANNRAALAAAEVAAARAFTANYGASGKAADGSGEGQAK
jgi:membrane protein insertase Oxa1/YidC/SpoIIIJ